MTCPKCNQMCEHSKTVDRDTTTPVRRYICRKCKIVVMTLEAISIMGKLTPRKKRE